GAVPGHAGGRDAAAGDLAEPALRAVAGGGGGVVRGAGADGAGAGGRRGAADAGPGAPAARGMSVAGVAVRPSVPRDVARAPCGRGGVFDAPVKKAGRIAEGLLVRTPTDETCQSQGRPALTGSVWIR